VPFSPSTSEIYLDEERTLPTASFFRALPSTLSAYSSNFADSFNLRFVSKTYFLQVSKLFFFSLSKKLQKLKNPNKKCVKFGKIKIKTPKKVFRRAARVYFRNLFV